MSATDPRQPLGTEIVTANSPFRRLLDHADAMGGIFRLDGFREALVITNDAWIYEACGVPEHCFLLAAVPAVVGGVGDPDDEEVLLLRVLGAAALPTEADAQRLRAKVMHQLLTEANRESPRSPDELVDALTKQEMQTSGLRCAVLGTFYDVDEQGTTRLAFGSDIDNAYGYSRFCVYKPYGDSLETVVSFLKNVRPGDVGAFELGHVRYASTRRRELRAQGRGKPTDVPVRVNVVDFVGHKTAVFGMTRLGKSNTMKTLATATFRHAHETAEPIGQLIFDPAGEYANVNVQDGTALAQLGAEFVRVYRFGASREELQADANLRPLSLNFFDINQLAAAWSVICQFIEAGQSANYKTAFMNADPCGYGDAEADEPRRREAHTRRVRMMLYATLLKANLRPAAGHQFWAPLNQEMRAELAALGDRFAFLETSFANRRGEVALTAQQLRELAEYIATEAQAERASEHVQHWYDADERIDAVADLLTRKSGSGYTILTELNQGYHSAASEADYAPAIYDDLVAGRIVIVDLSRGSDVVLQFSSERVVRELLTRQQEIFRTGGTPPAMQVFLEEAHVLLDRDKFKFADSARDPYVRLAKEAAKFRIGMVYATQEVKSVEERILDNTANWVVAHLNSLKEIKELAHRYDFERFSDQILYAEDRGFVRLKTLSSPYVIPIQVRLFDAEMIREARAVALSRIAGQAELDV